MPVVPRRLHPDLSTSKLWSAPPVELEKMPSYLLGCTVRSVLRQCCWAPKVLESLEIFVLCVCVQSCPTFCDPMDCSPLGSPVPGILQARILEWVAMPSSRASSQPRGQICIFWISCIAGGFFTTELMGKPPQRHYVMWKKTYTHKFLLYDSIYMELNNQ